MRFVLLVALLLVVACTPTDLSPDAPAEPVFCTQEVKECPDGSYVGRGPPDCAFKPCPAA